MKVSMCLGDTTATGREHLCYDIEYCIEQRAEEGYVVAEKDVRILPDRNEFRPETLLVILWFERSEEAKDE